MIRQCFGSINFLYGTWHPTMPPSWWRPCSWLSFRLYPTVVPISSLTRAANIIVGMRLGWVTAIRPRGPSEDDSLGTAPNKFDSYRNCGTCVDFPHPVSPVRIKVWYFETNSKIDPLCRLIDSRPFCLRISAFICGLKTKVPDVEAVSSFTASRSQLGPSFPGFQNIPVSNYAF